MDRTPTTTRRWLTTAAALAFFVVTSSACYGTWGLRGSYRDYVTSGIAQGQITVKEGAKWLDGPTTGKGPFQWPIEYAVFDEGTETGVIQFKGGVNTAGHPTPEGYLLETAFWNPRLEINGDTGTLFADLNYRPSGGMGGGEPAHLAAATDVAFATVDLSGVDWTAASNGSRQISNAPMVGITATMQLIGWDAFYGDPVTLDPFSVLFYPNTQGPELAAAPKVVVSQTTDLEAGDVITAWGWGFDPAVNIGTRPPLAGQQSGVYVTFGKFATTWQPSAGAPSASRVVISQKWALPAASRAMLDPAGTNPAFVEIDEFGRFKATMTVAENAAVGNYGVYIYAGGGAVNTAHEIAVPVTLEAP